ncbi:hypothetical protein ED312_11325 [Sinomicrobium pectinilyticum]|uniref:Uncharacterized protein n=1 Tax=Sinomicrobium pectinilyticum TaxID=1084421 RepID=A0A3N0EEN7_SINP1|nr:hypothetical protein ED312_11325 [Sinomicrobium pectinilyticum]
MRLPYAGYKKENSCVPGRHYKIKARRKTTGKLLFRTLTIVSVLKCEPGLLVRTVPKTRSRICRKTRPDRMNPPADYPSEITRSWIADPGYRVTVKF